MVDVEMNDSPAENEEVILQDVNLDQDALEKEHIRSERNKLADQCIKQHTAGSMVIGIVPIPLLDLAGLLALQLKMLYSLSKIFEVEFKSNMGATAVRHLASGITPVSVSVPVIASLSKFVPVIGQTLSGTSLVVLNGAATYGIGRVFQQHFAAGGNFQDFKPVEMRDYFNEQFKQGLQMVKSLRSK